MRFRRQAKPWRGLLAGALGGLAASFLMGPLHALAQKAGSSEKKNGEEDSTMKAASAISENVLNHELTPREKKIAGPAVHFAFGASMGAIYGLAAEEVPAVRSGYGALFGAAVWLGAHVVTVPALGWAKPVMKSPWSKEAGEFGAHLAYGTVSEGVRRAMRAYVLR